MKIITVATHSQGYFPILASSCKRHNIELTILGWGDKWKGFGWKLMLLKKYFESLANDERVLVLDGFDSFIISDSNEILHKIEQLNKPIVCAAERRHANTMWNAAYEKIFNSDGLYPSTPTVYHYLNAGGWITTAGYALELLNNPWIRNSTNDQAFLTYLYLKEKVFIDYNCEIFTCIRRESDLTLTKNRFKNVFTNSYPCIIHAPADVSMRGLVSQLGYEAIQYNIVKRAWKYLYSGYAFWGSKSYKKLSSE